MLSVALRLQSDTSLFRIRMAAPRCLKRIAP